MDEEKLNKGVYEGEYSVLAIPFFLREYYFKELLSRLNTGVSARKLEKYILNILRFSGAKAQTQVLELQGVLFDGRKKVEADKFYTAAEKVNIKYDNWLRTEQDVVEDVSKAAAQWESIDKNVKYLKYNTMDDSRVRPEHGAWDEVTKPVNDPFWDTRYPPNDWNCRCFVTELKEGKETDLKDHLKKFNATQKRRGNETLSSLKNTNKDFSVNWGKVDYIFNNKHSYFKTSRKYKVKEANYVRD